MGVELVGSVLGGNGGLDVPNFFFIFLTCVWMVLLVSLLGSLYAGFCWCRVVCLFSFIF